MKDIILEVVNSYINDIINESKDLLTERVSSIIYHWCSPQTAVKILNTNRFSLMNNLFKNAESNIIGTSHNRMWYMSLTRNGKIGMGGYSNNNHPWVRLTLDGDRINSTYHTKGIDYWGASMGKNSRYQNAKEDGTKIKKPGVDTESEDRLFSRKPFIENALSYIKAIDMYFDITKYDASRDSFINSNTVECIYYLFLSCNKSLNCNVYTSVQDFNNHKNPIDIDSFREWFYKQKETRDLNYYDIEDRSKLPDKFLASIVYIVNFLDGDLNDCIRTLREYGLDKYIKKVVKCIKNNSSWDYKFYFGDKSTYQYRDIKREILRHFVNIELGNEAQSLNREDLAKAYSILSDFCNKHKVKTKYDIINYFARELGKEDKNINGNQIFDITCVKLPINSNIYLCVNPSKTKYADVFGKDYLRYLYGDLIYYVDSHKSKDNTQFKLYLNRLIFKSQPTVQDIIDLYDRLKSLDNERLELDYKPELIIKQADYWNVGYVLRNPDYEYGNSLITTDGDSIRVKDKEQYKQLKELVEND